MESIEPGPNRIDATKMVDGVPRNHQTEDMSDTRSLGIDLYHSYSSSPESRVCSVAASQTGNCTISPMFGRPGELGGILDWW